MRVKRTRGDGLTNQEQTENQAFEEAEQKEQQQRQVDRENAKRVLRDSGLAEMMQSINKNLLKGRGWFEEYDSTVIFKWGTGYTRRHIWIDVAGTSIRFRLLQHRKCMNSIPLCDGEYHTFTSQLWADKQLLQMELKKYYDRPVAETSSD
jgi:hypothetical protein